MSEEMENVMISVTSEIGFGHGGGRSLPIETAGAPIGSATPRNTKLVPHYLKASTGSCHDLCKFGIKHSSEVKKARPVFPKRLNDRQKPCAAHDQIETRNYQQRKEKKELRLKISQKKVHPTDGHKVVKQMDLPPEKIIQLSDSSTNLTETSDQEPRNLNDETSDKHLLSHQDKESSEGSVSIKSMIPSSFLEGNESGAHKSASPSKELFDESVNLNYNGTPIGSAVNIEESMDLVQGEDSSVETYASSTRKNIESVEHVMYGLEELSDKTLSNRKLKTLERSTTGSTKAEGHIDKCKASGKHKPSGYLGGARKPESPRKLKTSIQRIRSPVMHNTPVSRAGGSSSEQSQMKRLSTGDKPKKEVNKLKYARKSLVDIDRPEASTDEVGLPNVIKKNFRKTLEESVKSKTGTEETNKLSMTRTATSVTPMVHKKMTSEANRAVGASIESATSMKLRKVVLKSSRSSSLKGLTGRMNQHESTYVVGQPKGGEGKAPEEISTPPSSKPHHTQVSSLKLKKLKSVSLSPSLTGKNQTKVGRLSFREKTLHATELTTEKVDLNAMKQKLREHASHSLIGKQEHEGSTSKDNEVDKSTPPREVIRRSSRDTSSELKLKHRRTVSKQSVERLSRTLNFSRGKVVKLQPENTTPAWIRFKQTKAVVDKLSTKGVVGRSSFRNKIEAGDRDMTNHSSKAPAIVLRHTDVQDKEVQGLLNSMIEETASKLVESRKSKVKALVGAFETVISLQESKTPVSVP